MRANRWMSAILCFWLVACASPGATQQQSTVAPPAWWTAHVDFMTRGGGAWLAPNPAGESDPNAPDMFGMEWRAVNDGRGLVGRLYGVEAGRETVEFWTYREFWHPGERRILLQQWGGPGVYGVGETTSSAPNRGAVDQTFWLPDGRAWREGHRTEEEGDVYVTESYDITAAGDWQLSNSTTWRRVSNTEPQDGGLDALPANRLPCGRLRSRV